MHRLTLTIAAVLMWHCVFQVQLQLPVTAAGICNAVAFWFELHLDEETHLSTSPYCQQVNANCVTLAVLGTTDTLTAMLVAYEAI